MPPVEIKGRMPTGCTGRRAGAEQNTLRVILEKRGKKGMKWRKKIGFLFAVAALVCFGLCMFWDRQNRLLLPAGQLLNAAALLLCCAANGRGKPPGARRPGEPADTEPNAAHSTEGAQDIGS